MGHFGHQFRETNVKQEIDNVDPRSWILLVSFYHIGIISRKKIAFLERKKQFFQKQLLIYWEKSTGWQLLELEYCSNDPVIQSKWVQNMPRAGNLPEKKHRKCVLLHEKQKNSVRVSFLQGV